MPEQTTPGCRRPRKCPKDLSWRPTDPSQCQRLTVVDARGRRDGRRPMILRRCRRPDTQDVGGWRGGGWLRRWYHDGWRCRNHHRSLTMKNSPEARCWTSQMIKTWKSLPPSLWYHLERKNEKGRRKNTEQITQEHAMYVKNPRNSRKKPRWEN